MRSRLIFIALASFAFYSASFAAEPNPDIVTKDTPRDFPSINSAAEWHARARIIREQILISAGLWPMPDKTPLHAHVFGKTIHDGYSVEKVYFQSWPGFYVCGNLYRPLGHGDGPFPVVLNTHGHSEHGRLEDSTNSSTVARCINFARQGMIAFAYDMVGYNDTRFPGAPANAPFANAHRSFATNEPANQLWNISLMGLQLWDSIRAIDFVESLPDIDVMKIAITGESGGGTQTYLLGAVEDRLAAQAPVVMVSHTMQGGCYCENMPGLRVQFSNVEIAAAAAPRSQIMVAATGDWTKTMLTMEGPSVANIYDLLGAPEYIRYVRFDAPHNYNQTSREAVYRWFDHWLLNQPDAPVKESAYEKETDGDLRIFPDGKLAADAVTQQQLIDYLKRRHQANLQRLDPANMSPQDYRRTMIPAWAHTMQLPLTKNAPQSDAGQMSGRIEIPCSAEKTNLGVWRFVPVAAVSPLTRIVLVSPEGAAPFVSTAGQAIGLTQQLLDHGYEVVVPEKFPDVKTSDQFSIFYDTYNRTQLQKNVCDIVSICAAVQLYNYMPARLILCGTGRAGLWCMLAAPAADGTIADECQLDVTDDANLLAPDLFCPGIRNLDTFSGPLVLSAPRPLLVHNAAANFPTDHLRAGYAAVQAENLLRIENRKFSNDDIIYWLSRMDR